MSIRLTIDEGYRRALAVAGLDSFDALMHADAGEIVTRRKDRETRRVELRDGDATRTIYIKRIFSIGPKHSFWPRLAGRACHTPAIKEYNAIETLTAAGIPTARAVACGERRSIGFPRCGFLVTEAVPFKWTLNHWLTEGYERPRALSGDERLELMRGLGELVTKLSLTGAVWPDLKAKHAFAELGEIGAWQFCLIDLERMVFDAREKQRGALAFRSLAKGVPIIQSLMPTSISKSEVEGFWIAASLDEVDPSIESDSTRLAAIKQVAMISRHEAIKFGGDGQPRLPDDFRHPNTLPMENLNGMRIDPRYVEALRAAGLESYDAVMALSDGAQLNKPGLASYRERIRLTLDVDGEPHTVYLKRFKKPPLHEQLRRMWEFRFARGSAEREMHYNRHLGLLGIPTMTRVAFGSRMRGWWEQSGFGMTTEVAGESLEKLVERWSGATDSSAPTEGGRYGSVPSLRRTTDGERLPTPAERREIIDQLARIAARMHGNGLFHRDFYLCHIFMSRRTDGRIVLSVIDLGRMIRSSMRSERWKIKDLAALDYSSPSPLVTRADRLRFLYDYHRHSIYTGVEDLRKKVRQTAALVRKRVHRMARHDTSRMRRLDID